MEIMEKSAAPSAEAATEPRELNLRADLISKAVQFLKDEKVSRTSVDHQKAFLQKKGLSSEEIDEAYRKVDENRINDQINIQNNYASRSRDLAQNRIASWRDYANLLVLAGGATFITFTFVKNYIMPRWMGVPTKKQQQLNNVQESLAEVQNGLKFLIDSVQQTLSVVQKQQDVSNKLLQQIASKEDNTRSIERTMYELKSEMTVIKNLLLGRDQFPPVPQNKTLSLPAWQQTKPQNGPVFATSNVRDREERVFMNRGDTGSRYLLGGDDLDEDFEEDPDLEPPPSSSAPLEDSEKTTPV